MSKNIIICLDGTWNDRDLKSEQTNVSLIYEMCDNSSKNEQICYYDAGVGTGGLIDKKLGGLHGKGLSKNIRQAYGFLIDHFQLGDKVFLFGFSRGAYSVRSLSGLLSLAGLPKEQNNQNIIEIYNKYKKRDLSELAKIKSKSHQCEVEMIGVWDTVGALGIPISFFKKLSARLFQFHDVKLSKEVKAGYHAIAIDEMRKGFEPTLWNETDDRVTQVWFSGVHSDIGGGYRNKETNIPERHHSNIALEWMVQNAKKHGVIFQDLVEKKSDVTQDIHASFKGLGRVLGKKKRDASIVIGKPIPKVHKSVVEKVVKKTGYDPIALSDHIDNLITLSPYDIVDYGE